ncbi:MAG: DUF2478 domain-containing protein [Deltaproteobacteria bacterium]|nr:DUF2478 domain-containing protein [Deltaproteobacteria bacterium]
MPQTTSNVVIVYGPPHAGRTTAVLRLCDLLAEHGLRIGGFFQRALVDDQDRRGYDLVHLANRSETTTLARPAAAHDSDSASAVCSFVFSPAGLATGRAWLAADAATANVLVIDEVSKLEVAGGGHCEAVQTALALPADRTVLLSVRADELTYVVEKFDLADRIRGYIELPATEEQLALLARRLVNEA